MPTTAPSGLDGLGQRFADALGSLVPSPSDGALPKQPVLDPPKLDDPMDDAGVDKPDETDSETADDSEIDCSTREHKEGELAPTAGESTADEPPPVEPAPAADAAAPEPTPPPAPPEAPEEPVAEAGTPCEIAADELPQAGQ